MSFADLNLVDCIQGSQEWFDARIGMLGSSTIKDVVTKRKKSPEPLQAYLDLRLDLAVERITKKPMEHYVSIWMERGKELEPMARAAYELRTDSRVTQVGFVLHPDRERLLWAGCSPDGLVGDVGLTEYKVPKSSTHAEYLLGECVPEEYQPQMLWQMACCPGYQWVDFASYCPDFPEPLDLFICRLPRDDKRIAEMEAEASKFLQEVEAMATRIKGGIAGALRASLAQVSAV